MIYVDPLSWDSEQLHQNSMVRFGIVNVRSLRDKLMGVRDTVPIFIMNSEVDSEVETGPVTNVWFADQPAANLDVIKWQRLENNTELDDSVVAIGLGF